MLISPNREKVPDPVYPLGLSYLSSALKQKGHDVASLDLCFVDDIDTAIRQSIESFGPDVIGLSLRNIDDVSYPRSVCYVDNYKDIVGLARKYSDAKIVLGGAGLTIMPEAFMKELDADYAIAGEGESAFLSLIEDLEAGRAVKEGIIRSDNMKSDIWTDIVPDRTLFDADTYYEQGGMLNIQTKRGCPFQCIYCSYPLIEGRSYRMRTPGAFVEELSYVVDNTGVRHFFIVDSVFNHPVDYAESICDAIIDRDLDIQWTCYGTPLGMTDRLAEKMKRAGCVSIEFGIDSLIDEQLAVLKKGFTCEDIRSAADTCRSHGIKQCHFIFVGAPGDTIDSVNLNLERLESLGADVSMIMAGIRIFPNTALAAIAKEDLNIQEEEITLKPVYYISPEVIGHIHTIVEEIKDNHPKWVMPGFEVNISEKLQALLRKAGIKGSLWEELIKR
ncbi:MAG: lipid biosynthesis B12-binding/radical SAM protein [Thermodesulfovibrionales bacterium]